MCFDKRFSLVSHSDLHNFELFISHRRVTYEIKVYSNWSQVYEHFLLCVPTQFKIYVTIHFSGVVGFAGTAQENCLDCNFNYIIYNLKKDLFNYCLEPNLNSGQLSRSGIFSEIPLHPPPYTLFKIAKF